MDNEKVKDIETKIDNIKYDIIKPLRLFKFTDIKLLDYFYSLLDQLIDIFQSELYMPRSLVSLLLLIYSLFFAEVRYAPGRNKFTRLELLKFKNYLNELFLGIKKSEIKEFENISAFQQIADSAQDPYLYIKLGEYIEICKGDFEKSIFYYNRALQLDKDYAEAYICLGDISANIYNDHQKAIEFYHKAIKINSAIVEVYIDEGRIYEVHNGYDEDAIKSFEKAIELDKNCFDAYFGLGNLYDKNNDYEKALEYYKKCICIKPDSVEVYKLITYILNCQGKNKERYDIYKKIIELDPYDDHIYLTMSIFCRNVMKNEKEAQEYLEILNNLQEDHRYLRIKKECVFYDKYVSGIEKIFKEAEKIL